MTIRNKILILSLSVCMAVIGCSICLYINSQYFSVKNFVTHTEEILRISGKYLASVVNSSMNILTGVSKLSAVTQAEGTLSEYRSISEPHRTAGDQLTGNEKVLFDIFSTFADSTSNFDLFYMGTEKDGGFVQAPDEQLGPNYDPRKRPWYTIAKQAGETPVLTNFYISTNGNLVTAVAKGVSNPQ